jgi:putative SOS response-associated peptidase YedK
MAQLFDARPANDLPVGSNFNICPTMPLAVLRLRGAQRFIGPMRWGFIPGWYKSPTDGPLLINARAETLAEKPAFRDACRQRRCLIPVSGFYEWQREHGEKQPYYVTRSDGAPLVMAGIWQEWGPRSDRLNSCAIVTCSAAPPLDGIHHRSPVVLEPEAWSLWLGEAGHGAARLMQSPASDVLRMHRVSRAVNSNRAEGPELIEPV